jgi:hypothetical protein
MKYKKDFPNFDYEIPKLEGFEDDSWINDVCPSFYNPHKHLKVFFDYEDTLKREAGGLKYTLWRYYPFDDVMQFIDQSDNLEDIKALIKQY